MSMKKIRISFSILIVLSLIIGMLKIEVIAAKKEVLKTYDGMVIGEPVTTKVDKKEFITVEMLTQGKRMLLKTQAIDSNKVDDVKVNLVKGNLVDYKINKGVVVIPKDPSKTFNKVLQKGDSTDAQFDTMKYGPELSPTNSNAGNMVAAGWVFNKTKNTITVGDGRIVKEDISGRTLPEPVKRYEETYKIDKNVAVYNVNTEDYEKSLVSNFQSIPVTGRLSLYNYEKTSGLRCI